MELKLTEEIKISDHILIPDDWFGIDTERYFYLFTGGAEIRLDKHLINIDEYLKELYKNRNEK